MNLHATMAKLQGIRLEIDRQIGAIFSQILNAPVNDPPLLELTAARAHIFEAENQLYKLLKKPE